MTITIHARGFGPVRSGIVTLEPLTIFLGPNNTGKSYLAMLAYALTHRSPVRPISSYRLFEELYYPHPTRIQEIEMTPDAERLVKMVRDEKRYQHGILSETTLRNVETMLVDALSEYAKFWKSEIERCFGQEFAGLVQAGRRGNCIAVEHGHPNWQLKIGLRSGDVEISARPDAEAAMAEAAALKDGLDRYPMVIGPRPALTGLSSAEPMWTALLQRTVQSCFREFPPAAYYLPAARSGILQSHKTLTSLMWRRASLVGLEDLNVPTMTGVLTDFISLLLSLPRRRPTALNKIATYIERGVLRGDVRIKSGSAEYPEITYEPRTGKYALHTTSSMVSELAPVVLFLRHFVNPGDVLIIEEPESHLHPYAQREVARVIARLVNAGVITVITTHSDYFMTQLNNIIAAGELTDDERIKAGLESEDHLSANLVAAYLFHPDDQKLTEVKRLPVDHVHGIPLKEFTAVAEGLYNETLTLESRIYDGG